MAWTVGGRATPATRSARLAAGRGAARTKMLAVVGDLGLAQRVKVGADRGPGAGAAERRDALLQLGLEHQGEEEQNTWPRMVASSLWKIGRVASRCSPYGSRLHGPQLLVAQHGGERVEIGVGA